MLCKIILGTPTIPKSTIQEVKQTAWESLAVPVVRTQCFFTAMGLDSILGWETRSHKPCIVAKETNKTKPKTRYLPTGPVWWIRLSAPQTNIIAECSEPVGPGSVPSLAGWEWGLLWHVDSVPQQRHCQCLFPSFPIQPSQLVEQQDAVSLQQIIKSLLTQSLERRCKYQRVQMEIDILHYWWWEWNLKVLNSFVVNSIWTGLEYWNLQSRNFPTSFQPAL